MSCTASKGCSVFGNVPLKYQSGEQIAKGDRVLFHGEPGEIELVADPLANDPETEW